MKFRNTLALALLFGALGAYLWWVERPKLEREGETPTVFEVDVDQVSRVSLEYPDRTIEAVRTAAGWRLQKPIEVAADETAVENLARAVAELELKRTLEGKPESLESFGLDQPKVIVTLTLESGEALPSIRVGKTSPVGWSTFVQIEGSEEVTLVPSAFWYGMDKKVSDLRDKTILAFEEGDVSRLSIRGGERAVDLFRAGDEWRLGGTEGAPAEESEIRSYLSTVQTLRAEDFVDDPESLADYGLAEPRRRIVLGLGDDETRELWVGAEKAHGDEDVLFVKRADGDTVYAVGTWAFASLDKPSAVFRDKTVLSFDREALSRVEVRARGAEPFTLVRTSAEVSEEGEEAKATWNVEGAEASRSETIAQLVADLHSLKGYEIAAETPTDVAPYGLDDPDRTFVLRGASGEEIGTILTSRRDLPAQAGEEDSAPESAAFAMAEGGPVVLRIRDYVFSHLDKSRDDLVDEPEAADPD